VPGTRGAYRSTNRRGFLLWASACLAAWPIPAQAQSAERVYRVGFLRPGRQGPPGDLQMTGIRTALRELGYLEGRNLVVDLRFAEGSPARLPALARALVQAPVDVIVAVGSLATQAAKEATPTLPIVMYGNFDPLALRLVDSLARPSGNVTGVLIAPDGTLASKRLELLKAAVPRASRIALLVPDDDSARLQVEETRQAAASLGVELVVVTVRGKEYSRAFAAIVAERPGHSSSARTSTSSPTARRSSSSPPDIGCPRCTNGASRLRMAG
jgi:putative ABC transport system substrate-binding protein